MGGFVFGFFSGGVVCFDSYICCFFGWGCFFRFVGFLRVVLVVVFWGVCRGVF